MTEFVSLFEKKATQEDCLPIHPIYEEMSAYVEKMKDVAGNITENYDRKRKAEKEAKGQVWQNSRRGTKQVVKDRRAEAEAQKTLDDEFDEELGVEEEVLDD